MIIIMVSNVSLLHCSSLYGSRWHSACMHMVFCLQSMWFMDNSLFLYPETETCAYTDMTAASLHVLT